MELSNQLMSIGELEDFLGVSRTTVKRMLREGLPAYRVSARLKFDQRQVLESLRVSDGPEVGKNV